MVAISRNTGSYALIASASLKPNADALRKLAQAAGNSVSTTQTTLINQSLDLKRFVEKVSTEADPVASLETARGLSRSSDISGMIVDALRSAEQRFAAAQGLNSSRPSSSAGNSSGAALVAMLRGAANGGEDFFDFSALLARPNASRIKPSQINVSAARQDQPDIYDRGIPLTTAVGGTATISVSRTALRLEPVTVLLDKSNPDLGGIQGVSYLPDGASRADNEGFYIKSATGQADDTVVLDTRDPTDDDTRISAIDLDTGDGSDLVFIAGENISRINAGAGDDFVAVEGDAIVEGGDGDDLIYARTASGDAGDDVIFTDGFASGGDGSDNITVFSLDSENDEVAKLAYGGAGDDEIVASVRANIDGGDGDDVLILRDGGSAGGGDGDDRISAWATSSVEGGAGADDIFLLRGGSVDAGDGDDKVEIGDFAEVAGGKGNDTVTMNGGGVYTFRKGDGTDSVSIAKTQLNINDPNTVRMNRVVLDGFDYADLAVTIGATEINIKPTGLNFEADELKINRADILGKMELVFRKDGYEQVLQLDGFTETMGARVPYTPTP